MQQANAIKDVSTSVQESQEITIVLLLGAVPVLLCWLGWRIVYRGIIVPIHSVETAMRRISSGENRCPPACPHTGRNWAGWSGRLSG